MTDVFVFGTNVNRPATGGMDKHVSHQIPGWSGLPLDCSRSELVWGGCMVSGYTVNNYNSVRFFFFLTFSSRVDI